MWLRSLVIKNFRQFKALEVHFAKGLTAIVGENNAGKTTVIDALRVMLFSGRDPDALRFSEDDFHGGDAGTPIELTCRFVELDDEDEAHFQEALVDLGNGKFEMQTNARIRFNPDTQRCTVKLWGGETEGFSLAGNHFDRIAAIYLPPLRDPEKGLRAGARSQVARLVHAKTKQAEQADFESIAEEANTKIRALNSVVSSTTTIAQNMEEMTSEEMTPKVDLVFSDPAFRRIVAALELEIDGRPLALSGLGMTNLAFAGTVIGTYQHNDQFSMRAMLIEEPEAHLHPQLQALFLRYLAKVASPSDNDPFQVIVSTHSPVLASQAPIDSILALGTSATGPSAILLGDYAIDADLKKKLERYLDATRAELFFAKRLVLVEGLAEALLLPVFARILGGDLKRSAVTLLSAGGLNFNAFLPLFEAGRIAIPVSLLTDGDAEALGKPCSSTANALKTACADLPTTEIFLAERTFEHELARMDALRPAMLNALTALHPIKGPKIADELNGLGSADEKADHFFQRFEEIGVQKGPFAQELAAQIEAAPLPSEAVPDYIRAALVHVGVITSPEAGP